MRATSLIEANPSALKALGDAVKTYTILKGTRGSDIKPYPVYAITEELRDKFVKFYLSSESKIDKGDKIYFTPTQKLSNSKIKEVLKNLGATKKNTIKASDVVVLGSDWLNDGGYKSSNKGLVYSNSVQHYIVDSSGNELVRDIFDITSDETLIVPGDSTWTFNSKIRSAIASGRFSENQIVKNFPSGTYYYSFIEHNSRPKHLNLVSGEFINTIYEIIAGKKRAISQAYFNKTFSLHFTELSLESAESIIKMFYASDEDRKLAALLLANSNFKEEPYLVWKIANSVNSYYFNGLLQLKDVRYFVQESDYERLNSYKSYEFLSIMHEKGINPFTCQEQKDDFIKLVVQKDFPKVLGSSFRDLAKAGIINMSVGFNLDY